VYATGANAIGVPGCPEFAACTASIDNVPMVFTANLSIGRVAGSRAGRVPTVIAAASLRWHRQRKIRAESDR
jgi:hypothetical protein